MGYRAFALSLPRRTFHVGPAAFHGLAPTGDPTLPEFVASQYPGRVTTLTFFRQSPEGQAEPNYIHTDRDMGEWTAILYLTPDAPPEDGTTFWRHRETGRDHSVANDDTAWLAEALAWRDEDQWEPWRRVEATFNRVVLFSAGHFHSRAIHENYGHGETARLTQIAFGKDPVCP